jgi:Putative zinc-finger
MSGWFYKMLYPCDQVRDFMYDYLEENLPTLTSIRFHLHLNGCPECREYLFLYKKAADAKAFRAEHPAPDAFLASTLAFLELEGVVEAGPEDGSRFKSGSGPESSGEEDSGDGPEADSQTGGEDWRPKGGRPD